MDRTIANPLSRRRFVDEEVTPPFFSIMLLALSCRSKRYDTDGFLADAAGSLAQQFGFRCHTESDFELFLMASRRNSLLVPFPASLSSWVHGALKRRRRPIPRSARLFRARISVLQSLSQTRIEKIVLTWFPALSALRAVFINRCG